MVKEKKQIRNISMGFRVYEQERKEILKVSKESNYNLSEIMRLGTEILKNDKGNIHFRIIELEKENELLHKKIDKIKNIIKEL